MAYDPNSPRSAENHPDSRYYDEGGVCKSLRVDLPGAVERFRYDTETAGVEFTPRKTDNFRVRSLIEETNRDLHEAEVDIDPLMRADAAGTFFRALEDLNIGLALDVMQDFIRRELKNIDYTLPADIMENREFARLVHDAKGHRLDVLKKHGLPVFIALDVGTFEIAINGRIVFKFRKKEELA
ncbi:MAG: hypothetical protein US89_C0015G0025 [Candidatus Peregrinibacteria bacterium GW2011_GWF2_38_29]|nr:MAG: hypothetical protein US89_C0015G0025 [Candidatus Peregrinibacteria bacterium GW2011_GWF2_38_29]HBB02715.1 hypothetical protein [Candidatus Peregrinibacteria bacterium]